MTPITTYNAHVADQRSNAHYLNRHFVATEADLDQVAHLDHVAAVCASGTRTCNSSITSSCLVMGIDGPHAYNPSV